MRVASFVAAAMLAPAAALNIAITGSSQGIGLSAARQLLADGHNVFHACRSAERAAVAAEAAGGGTPLVCDLADLASVRSFAAELSTSATPLDVLCLNAGIAPSTRAELAKRTVDGFEECVGVNHLGHFALAHALLPSLRRGGAGGRGGTLVVTASSVHDPEGPGGAVGGKDGATLGDLSGLGATQLQSAVMVDGATVYNGAKVYKDSKLCNVLFTREAHRRWGPENGADGEGLRVRSFNPGFIPRSGLFRAPREDNWFAAAALTFVAERVAKFAVPIDVGGARLAYMATAPDSEVPPGSYLSAPTGAVGASRNDGFVDAPVSCDAQDAALAARLWESSVRAIGLQL